MRNTLQQNSFAGIIPVAFPDTEKGMI